jgi:hypothetical protein
MIPSRHQIVSSSLLLLLLLHSSASSVCGAEPRRPVSAVEYKVMLNPASFAKLKTLLPLSTAKHKRQQIFFFDTRKQKLMKKGVVLRLRRTERSDGSYKTKATVKLRPRSAESIPRTWFEEEGFKHEVDRVSTREVGTASLAVKRKDKHARRAMKGKKIKKLFSKKQRRLLKKEGAKLDWDSLKPHGPIVAEVWELRLEGISKTPLTLQTWRFGDQEFLEISIRDSRERMGEIQKKLDAWLGTHQIAPAPAQTTKTRSALQFFGRQLDAQ